jgi:hypothetical protein
MTFWAESKALWAAMFALFKDNEVQRANTIWSWEFGIRVAVCIAGMKQLRKSMNDCFYISVVTPWALHLVFTHIN